MTDWLNDWALLGQERSEISAFFNRAFPGPLARSWRFTSITTPKDLNIPKPFRLPSNYTHALQTLLPRQTRTFQSYLDFLGSIHMRLPLGRLHKQPTISFTVFRQVPLLLMGEVRTLESSFFPEEEYYRQKAGSSPESLV